MTITGVTEKVDELISAIEELNHIPEEIRSSLVTQCENITDTLVDASNEYGDEESDATTEESDEY